MNEVALFCSSKATGRPQALSRRNTLQVVAVASRPLSGITSCLAPSPAVMSSFATTATRSEPLMRNIFLVLPSVTSAPSERALGCPAVGASTGSSCVRKRNGDNNRSTACHLGRRGGFSTRKSRVPRPRLGRLLGRDQLFQDVLVAHRANVDREGQRVHRLLRLIDDPLLRLDHRRVLLLEGEAAHLADLVLDFAIERLIGGLHVVADRGEEVVRGAVGFGGEDVDGVIAGTRLGLLHNRTNTGN